MTKYEAWMYLRTYGDWPAGVDALEGKDADVQL